MSASPLAKTSTAPPQRKGSTAIPRRDIHFQLAGVDLKHWNPQGPHCWRAFKTDQQIAVLLTQN